MDPDCVVSIWDRLAKLTCPNTTLVNALRNSNITVTVLVVYYL